MVEQYSEPKYFISLLISHEKSLYIIMMLLSLIINFDFMDQAFFSPDLMIIFNILNDYTFKNCFLKIL